MRSYFESKSAVAYWYSLGVGMIAIGLLGVFLQRNVGGPIGWAGRSAEYVGGIYFLTTVINAFRAGRSGNHVA